MTEMQPQFILGRLLAAAAMLELAKKGNVRCLEYCLDRLLPKRSGRPLDLQLPAIKGHKEDV